MQFCRDAGWRQSICQRSEDGKMSKEEIRVGLLNEQYPPEMVDWALEKVLTAEESQFELLSTLREWNKRGLPRNNRVMAGMATDILAETLKRQGVDEDSVLFETETLLLRLKFGEKGTRYFLQDENICSAIVVRDGRVGQLRFNHKTLAFDFDSYGRAYWRYIDFVREQLAGDDEKWDEIDECKFYEMWYLERCLWHTTPCAQDLEWRPGEFLEEINGVFQMRKGIAKELQNYLNEAEELLVEHRAMTSICHAENSALNQSIVRGLNRVIDSLKEYIESDLRGE